MFNASEYMHLSLHASSRGEHITALGFLKDALAIEPENAMVNYLIAVECAELGLHERAIRGLEESLAIEPRMNVARFQLCLLYSQNGQAAPALKHLAMLREDGDAELQLYAEALTALLGNDAEKAKERLALGLRAGGNNPALKRNMHNLFQQLVSLPAPPSEPIHVEPKKTSGPASLPGAYEQLRAAQ